MDPRAPLKAEMFGLSAPELRLMSHGTMLQSRKEWGKEGKNVIGFYGEIKIGEVDWEL